MEPLIGPFFYIRGKLLFNACPLSEGRKQAGRLDNSYGHERLYDDHFRTGDYIDEPRGRVIWDMEQKQTIIYIDTCVNRPEVLEKIIAAFRIDRYIVAFDDPYRCKDCVGDLFD